MRCSISSWFAIETITALSLSRFRGRPWFRHTTTLASVPKHSASPTHRHTRNHDSYQVHFQGCRIRARILHVSVLQSLHSRQVALGRGRAQDGFPASCHRHRSSLCYCHCGRQYRPCNCCPQCQCRACFGRLCVSRVKLRVNPRCRWELKTAVEWPVVLCGRLQLVQCAFGADMEVPALHACLNHCPEGSLHSSRDKLAHFRLLLVGENIAWVLIRYRLHF